MPFDGKTFAPVRQDVQNLLTLADALEREHEGFKWAFDQFYFKHDCGTIGCAIGMAAHIGIIPTEVAERLFPYESAGEYFGLTKEEAIHVFSTTFARAVYGVSFRQVTPAQVAAQIRRIAAEKMSPQETGNDG